MYRRDIFLWKPNILLYNKIQDLRRIKLAFDREILEGIYERNDGATSSRCGKINREFFKFTGYFMKESGMNEVLAVCIFKFYIKLYNVR